VGLKYFGDTDLLGRLKPQEPFFFVRAQDRFALSALRGYQRALEQGVEEHPELAEHLSAQARSMAGLVAYFEAWQANHTDWLKVPD